jgi:hypothetical protein
MDSRREMGWGSGRYESDSERQMVNKTKRSQGKWDERGDSAVPCTGERSS